MVAPAEREDDRLRHRAEHLPLDAGEREDRQVDDGDDELAEDRRACGPRARLRRRGASRSVAVEQAPEAVLLLGEAADAVLDDDHRAVDDEPEVDRAEAHQVAADPALDHAGHGEEHRERDGQRGDERRAASSRAAGTARRSPAPRPRAGSCARCAAWRRRGTCGRRRSSPRRPRAGTCSPPSSARRPAATTARLFSPTSMMAVPITDLLAVVGGGAGAQLAPDADVGDVADADRHAVVVPTTMSRMSSLVARARSRGSGTARPCARCSRRRRWRCSLRAPRARRGTRARSRRASPGRARPGNAR